ncbi:MAG: hypothetical protein EOO29_13825 [Comamonadaceae bacterium]|nr:MAG: hypothetical protein EOO29_13825 [Comamonadaceae bacterium]
MNSKQFASIIPAWDDQTVEQQVDAAIAAGRTAIRRSSMKIGAYNGYSGETRLIADRKIKVAIELGLIPKPNECSVCASTSGRIDYHAENYARPLLVAPICQKCHLALHNRLRGGGYAESWKRRVAQYGDGTKWFEDLVSGSAAGS